MDLPHRTITLLSLSTSFCISRFAPRFLLAGSFLSTWLFLHLSLLVLVGVVWQALLWPRFFSPLRGIPSVPGGSWINGHYGRIAAEPTGEPHKEWINTIPNKGMIRYMSILNKERLMITTPQAVGEVLAQNSYDYVKPAMLRNGLARVLGVGLILAEGDEHKTQRKNLMPAFAYRHIKDLYPVFWGKSCEMVDALMAEITRPNKDSGDDEQSPKDNSVIEIGGWGSRAALDIIGVAGMDYDFKAIENPDTELNATYRSVFQQTRSGQIISMLSLFLPQLIVRAIPASHNTNVFEASNTIKRVARDLIRKKQAKLDKNEKRTEVDILSVALESGGFSEENLVNQMMTFLAAGHETTGTTLTWACYEMCKNRSIQTRLREEIRANLPSVDSDSTITAEVLDKCHYLHAVCMEVLRLHAPVPITLRETVRDTTIQGQFVPKGTTIVLCIWAENTAVSQWGEDPNEFNPDRWMGPGKANSGGAVSNYSFLTFLHGPRSCIGQAFAKAEFACLLAALVGRFEFELQDPDKKIDIQGGITSKPKHGMHVRLKAVDGW